MFTIGNHYQSRMRSAIMSLYAGNIVLMQLEVRNITAIEWSHQGIVGVGVTQSQAVTKLMR